MKKMFKKLSGTVAVLALAVSLHAATTAVTIQQVVNSGLSQTYTSTGLSTGDTYTFSNDGRIFIHIKKTGAADCTLTITTQATLNGFAVTDRTVTVVATTGDMMVGPFPASVFNDASDLVSFTVSETAGLSFAVLKL